MNWNYTVVISCFLLLAFVVWQESIRPNRKRLLLRLVAGVAAVASMACLALPLDVERSTKTGANKLAVLLTEGYQADSVSNFLQKSDPQPPVYSLAQPEKASVRFGAIQVPPDSLALICAGGTDLHVFGYGLDEYELNDLQDKAFYFHPTGLPAGVQSINWVRRLTAGENLVVQGICHNPLSSPVRVCLSGLQATLDSTTIAAHTTAPFQLTGVPKLRGKALFSLTVLNQQDTLEQEPVPVEIDKAAPIKVLLLSSAPNFENRFIKDWLAKKEYAVQTRTLISTGKSDRQFANKTSSSADQVSTSLLQQTDVLISDPGALARLGAQEQGAIRAGVEERGLGLIIRADSLLPHSFYASSFPLVQTADSISILSIHTLEAAPDTVTWQAEQPLYIRLQPGSQPLVQTAAAGVLACSALYGSGKIVVTTIPNSYSWLLAGNHSIYDAYWSLLIRKAVRKETAQEGMSISPGLPLADDPVTIQMETSEKEPPAYLVSNTPVAYAQNALLPFEWQTRYWAKAGWQTGGGAASLNWYAYGAENWKGIRARQVEQLTKSHLLHTHRESRTGKETASYREPVSKIYFFIIFIISLVFLWIEKKYG